MEKRHGQHAVHCGLSNPPVSSQLQLTYPKDGKEERHSDSDSESSDDILRERKKVISLMKERRMRYSNEEIFDQGLEKMRVLHLEKLVQPKVLDKFHPNINVHEPHAGQFNSRNT